MILELTSHWPFLRRHICPPVLAAACVAAPPVYAHVSWVRLKNGRHGWLHHHEADGWIVQLADGTQVQTNEFVNITSAELGYGR